MELHLEPIKFTRNQKNGQFLKCHIPHNKGKKWSDYIDMRKAKRIIRIAKQNLKCRSDIGGCNKKKIVGIKDGKFIGVFESSNDAERKLGIQARNIRSVCNCKRNHAGGIKWFYEKNIEQWNGLLMQQEK